MPSLYPLRVAQVEHITDRAVVLRFEVPEALKEKFLFTAGQYLSLEATIEEEAIRRSYSICSAPHEAHLEVGIKQIPNGVFSSYAKKNIVEGSILNVAVPEGRFTHTPKSEEEKITAFAAGSGITPILSIAKTALKAGQGFSMVYGNTSPQELMFKDAINQLQQDFPRHFSVTYVYSRASASNAFSGRIDAAFIAQQWTHLNLKADKYYLCGPEAMIMSTQEALQAQGAAENNIFYELFTSSTKSATVPEVVVSEEPKVVVICDAVTHSLSTFTPGKTILDAAIGEKIDVPYSCQGGVCSSCIARIKEGKARMDTNQILTDSEIEEGLILTCQAHPTTATIVVDYDDV